MEYRKIKDEDEVRDAGVEDVGKSILLSVPDNDLSAEAETKIDSHREKVKWKRKSVVTLALTVLTSSQAILIVWSKRAGKYEYSVTTANFMVETLKCAISLVALGRIWKKDGVNEDNRLTTTLDEVIVYPIPAALYLVKNLLQYYIFAYVDAPGYQILKNFNIISTGVLYRIILKKKLSEIQWAAFVLLAAGCTTAQLNSNSDRVLQTPFQGWVMAIVMALLSGFAGVYTEAIIKKRPSRNINVQNFWLYVFGMCFNAVAILVQDFDAVMNKGFFHGYSFITVLMIFNHALSGIAVSMVMKYADNIVKTLGSDVTPKYLGDDMVILLGLSDLKAEVMIKEENDKGSSLFYSLEKWKPEMRPGNRLIVAATGDLVDVDDDVEEMHRLNKARVLIRTPWKPVYSTSVAMLLTAVVSVFLFGFHLSLAFFLGTVVVSVAIYLHSAGKIQR
ncbi:CMP-sialic acid transporter 4 [Glycine max]|nr:CMP-sialic acid transporter 4 [Glycine max]KAH1263980.1 CMP-sialic acid transporter 4 [Glycine max]